MIESDGFFDYLWTSQAQVDPSVPATCPRFTQAHKHGRHIGMVDNYLIVDDRLIAATMASICLALEAAGHSAHRASEYERGKNNKRHSQGIGQ